jgi:hypothetical protein
MFLGGGCDTGERPCHVRVGVYGTWASMDYAVQGALAPRSGRIRVRAVEPRHPRTREVFPGSSGTVQHTVTMPCTQAGTAWEERTTAEG